MPIQTKKRASSCVMVRPVFVGSGEIAEPGDFYDGADSGYLIAIGKARPFDKASEVVKTVERGGVEVRVVSDKPATAVVAAAAPAGDGIPDDTWTKDKIVSWIKSADPTVNPPSNAGKAQLLEAARDIAAEQGLE